MADVGAHLYHFTTGTLDRITDGCRPGCPYTTLLTATGDTHGLTVTGDHAAATRARENRRQVSRRLIVRYGRLVDDMLWRLR